MWYVQEKFKPQAMVELVDPDRRDHRRARPRAGGAVQQQHAAFGQSAQGGIGDRREAVAHAAGHRSYDKLIDCDIADMKNVGGGRDGGSITAAQFLQRFVQDGVAWAHLDIAGMAWANKGNETTPKGATAYGVRLLDRLDRRQLRGQ